MIVKQKKEKGIKMKKITVTLLATVVISVSSYAADQLNWFNSAQLLDDSGSAVTLANDWVLRMYKSTDASINFSAGDVTGDDVYLNLEISMNDNPIADGWLYYEITDGNFGDLTGSDSVYSVIFNNSSYASATKYAIIDSGLFSMPTSFDPPKDYDTGGTIAGDWQAVPEPATAMLLALGGGLAWLVRMKQRMG